MDKLSDAIWNHIASDRLMLNKQVINQCYYCYHLLAHTKMLLSSLLFYCFIVVLLYCGIVGLVFSQLYYGCCCNYVIIVSYCY